MDDDVKYIVLCKASNEHFTFASTKELMEYLNPFEAEHPGYHDDLRVFRVNGEMLVVPQETVMKEMVKAWMLREKK